MRIRRNYGDRYWHAIDDDGHALCFKSLKFRDPESSSTEENPDVTICHQCVEKTVNRARVAVLRTKEFTPAPRMPSVPDLVNYTWPMGRKWRQYWATDPQRHALVKASGLTWAEVLRMTRGSTAGEVSDMIATYEAADAP